jgi:hypothetical protein
MTTEAAATDAFAALRDALVTHDEAALQSVYADDAVITSYSERNRPSSASTLSGRGEIDAWIHDVMARNLEHQVSDELVSGDRFAFIETCVYPTGEVVIGTHVCEVRDGRIAHQVGVEAWDE